MRELGGERVEARAADASGLVLLGSWEGRADVFGWGLESEDEILSAKKPRRLAEANESDPTDAMDDRIFLLVSCSWAPLRKRVLAVVWRGVESLDVRRRGSRCSSAALAGRGCRSDGACSCDLRDRCAVVAQTGAMVLSCTCRVENGCHRRWLYRSPMFLRPSSTLARHLNILALESSADDTCAAVVSSSRHILSNIVIKQHDMSVTRPSHFPIRLTF